MPFADWLGCELKQAELSLRGRTIHVLPGCSMTRLVERLPATPRITLPQVGSEVPALRWDEVEPARPHHAAVLVRLRAGEVEAREAS